MPYLFGRPLHPRSRHSVSNSPRSEQVTAVLDHIKNDRLRQACELVEGSLVSGSAILTQNHCAALILKSLEFLAPIVERSTICAGTPAELLIRRRWIDLSTAMRQVISAESEIIYDEELCQDIIKLAGLPDEDLAKAGFIRDHKFGILRRQLLCWVSPFESLDFSLPTSEKSQFGVSGYEKSYNHVTDWGFRLCRHN